MNRNHQTFFFSITYFKFLQIQIIKYGLKRSDIAITINISICYGIIMYTVSYYIGHTEHEKTFNDFKTAHDFALAHWNGLDSTTRENYINNGWNTHIVINNGPWDEDEIITIE